MRSECSIPQYREFMSLTDGEVRQVVTDLFAPEHIGRIERYCGWNEIIVKVRMRWIPQEAASEYEVTLRPPFGAYAPVTSDFCISDGDICRYRQFCVAKGIFPYLKDNPYLAGTDTAARTVYDS